MEIKYKGYDVIQDKFFIETTNKIIFIDSFREYYEKVNHEIYQNACYTYIPKKRLEEIKSVCDINEENFYKIKQFINYNIENTFYNYKIPPKYNDKKTLQKIKKWQEHFYNCNTLEELFNTPAT